MIDLHCHILPGIDDGPEDVEESITMARAAVECGIVTLTATPHLRSDFPKARVDEISGRCADLTAVLRARGVDLEIVPAAEVSLAWALQADDAALRLASYGQRGRDILIETPTVGGSMLPTLIGQVAARGYRVTLAHPERLEDFRRSPDTLQQLVDRQVILQVNADSILGNPRRSGGARLAQQLCRTGMASVVASDAHRGYDRRPIGRLELARRRLNELVGEAACVKLVDAAPRAVLDGQPLPPIGPQSRPSLGSRLLGRRQ